MARRDVPAVRADARRAGRQRIADLELVGRLQSRIVSGSRADDGERIWAGIHDTLQETETSILRHIGHDARDDKR